MTEQSSLGKLMQTTNSRIFSVPTNNDHLVLSNNPCSISNFHSPLNKAKSLIKSKPNSENKKISIFLNRANSMKKNENGIIKDYFNNNQCQQFRSSYTEQVDIVNNGKTRYDHYGNKIEKGKKKHKLVFRDKLTIINDLESVSMIMPDDICKRLSNEENHIMNDNIVCKDSKNINNNISTKEYKIKTNPSNESQENCSCLCIIY